MAENVNRDLIEYVGKVKLDLSKYCGTDLYTDGTVEDELLKIAEEYSEEEYNSVISKRLDWTVLYHFSHVRENIVSWIPFKKTDKILEVGAGCGAITGVFTQNAGEVVSCDLSKKRSLINAHRHSNADNLTISVGNFSDVEKDLPNDFDYVCLIGVFEYGQCYIEGEKPYEEFLKMLNKHLKPGGRLIIAIENRLGLKYFAGCTEDHIGDCFKGITGYDKSERVMTFSRPALESIFNSAGISNYHFYYPYPDYKLMHTLYSDKRLPKAGELTDNLRNFDRDRLLLFDEKNAYDTLIEDGLFPTFSNSYLVVLGDDFNIDYAKFSNERAREYAIVTTLESCDASQYGFQSDCVIKKKAIFPEGASHIANMAEYCKLLTKRFEGSPLNVNKCVLSDDSLTAAFEYVNGSTFTQLLDEHLIKNNDKEGFLRLIDKYIGLVSYNEKSVVSDRDMIFDNLLIEDDGTYTLIDYEWSEKEVIPANEIVCRALHTYFITSGKRGKFNYDLICDKTGIDSEGYKALVEAEKAFQSKVTGDMRSLASLFEVMGKKRIDLLKQGENPVFRFQIYRPLEDSSFSEAKSEFVNNAYLPDDRVCVKTLIPQNEMTIRLDPLMSSCIVSIDSVTVNGKDFKLNGFKRVITNGRRKHKGVYLFTTNDPNIVLDLKGYLDRDINSFEANLTVTPVVKSLVERM